MYSPPVTRSRARNLKRKPFQPSTSMNAENVDNPEEILKLSTGTKKIRLTKDEKNLSGAPEGEIYDITVVADENLDPLQCPSLEWTSAIGILSSESTSWADKHSSVETIRKLSLHHQEVLDEERIGLALVEATRATGSLRSCICRNGILCLQSLYRLPFFMKWANGSHIDAYAESLTTLMNKSVNGPRFICASAVAALEAAVEKTPISLLSFILQPLSQHKNAEIANQSFLFVAEQSMRSRRTLTDQPNAVLATLLLFLERGMSGPRPAGREASKKALEAIISTVGVATIQSVVDTLVPDEKKSLFTRFNGKAQDGAVAAFSTGLISPKLSRSAVKKQKSQCAKTAKSVAPPSFRDHIKMWKTKQQEQKEGPKTGSGNGDSTGLDSVQLII